MTMTVGSYAIITVIALLGAVVIWLMLGRYHHRSMQAATQTPDDVALLFCDKRLLDASDGAVQLLGDDIKHLDDVIAALSQCFPDLATAIQRADKEGTVLKAGLKNTVTLHLTISQDILKIVLSGDLGYLAPSVDQQARKCAALMQDIREFSPQLVWREDADGKRCWANAAYNSFASGTDPQPFAGFSRDMQAEAQKQQRVACANDETRWFDVTTVASQGGVAPFRERGNSPCQGG